MTLDLTFHEIALVRGAASPSAPSNASGAATPPRPPPLQRYGSIELHRAAPATPAALVGPALPAVVRANLTVTERLGLDAFALRRSPGFLAAKQARPRQGEPWNMRGCHHPAPVALVGAPLAAAPSMPTSGWLEGSVAVATVIVNGPTADLTFTDAEQTKVVAEVQAGVAWLAAQAPASQVSFVHDIRVVNITTAADPDAADLEALWRDPAMTELGHAASWAGVNDYVRALRDHHQTQWAYVAFFVKYPLSWFAYATIGGPRLVMQYANDGWGPDNIDRVFAHETGHVFGLPDEYTASNCNCGGTWGRFLEPNHNCEACAAAGGVSCIMRGNDWASCQTTRAHAGWSGWSSQILPLHSQLALDVTGASTSNGAEVIQWPWHNGKNQRFLADPLDDGTFRLIAEHSGLVLDVFGASPDPGAAIIQWPWHGGPNQRFRLEAQGDGSYRIVAQHSGHVLDVEGASTGNGARLIQWPWHGGPNQRFRVLTRGASVQSVRSGLVLDVRGGSFDRGADVIQWPLHGGGNQRLRLGPLDDGTYRLLVEHSGMVLDVTGGSLVPGAKVIQWPWHGGNNQRFRVEPLGDGTFRLVAVHSGLALDIAGASLANGAELLQWPWHGGPNQRFRFV